MKLHLPSRLGLGAAFAVLLCAAPGFARGPQPAPPAAAKPSRTPIRPVKPVQRQPHLQEWMEHHSNLSLPDQLHALDNEPGFRLLDPQTQQRFRDQLVKLYNMTPQQRSRILEGNEALERMTPPQRQQFNFAVQQYKGLAPDRKRLVTSAFRSLRPLSQAERQAIINTDRFRAEFSDHERDVLKDLLIWEPYFSSQDPNEGP
jgi:hypothetical protein